MKKSKLSYNLDMHTAAFTRVVPLLILLYLFPFSGGSGVLDQLLHEISLVLLILSPFLWSVSSFWAPSLYFTDTTLIIKNWSKSEEVDLQDVESLEVVEQGYFKQLFTGRYGVATPMIRINYRTLYGPSKVEFYCWRPKKNERLKEFISLCRQYHPELTLEKIALLQKGIS